MSTIEERVSAAFKAADETGTPQEVLADDGKRVMLIVCPKVKRESEEDLRAQLAASEARVARLGELLGDALHVIPDGALKQEVFAALSSTEPGK